MALDGLLPEVLRVRYIHLRSVVPPLGKVVIDDFVDKKSRNT